MKSNELNYLTLKERVEQLEKQVSTLQSIILPKVLMPSESESNNNEIQEVIKNSNKELETKTKFPYKWIQCKIKCHNITYCDHANGLWVACSDTNGLYYSLNGIIWEQSNITSGKFTHCYHGDDPIYTNGLWVAYGWDGNGLYYSMNGREWKQSNMAVRYIQGCHYANGLWLACSKSGIYYSKNGRCWVRSYLFGDFFGCTYANGLWIVYGIGDMNYCVPLYYSEDGLVWSESNIEDVRFATYANGMWVACHECRNPFYYSLDGKKWFPGEADDYNKSTSSDSCHYANGIWVAPGYEETLWYSTNGKEWERCRILDDKGDEYEYCDVLEHCDYGNGLWIAFGDQSNTNTYYSKDGITWIFDKDGLKIKHCLYANGLWLACTYEGLYYLED